MDKTNKMYRYMELHELWRGGKSSNVHGRTNIQFLSKLWSENEGGGVNERD